MAFAILEKLDLRRFAPNINESLYDDVVEPLEKMDPTGQLGATFDIIVNLLAMGLVGDAKYVES